MKRILCILLIFVLLFTAAACNKNSDDPASETDPVTTTTVAPPVVKEQSHHKEFKNSNGKVVYVVDVVLPEISKFSDKIVKDYINEISLGVFNDACESAERNIENASDFMTKYETKNPWTKKITFETTYADGRFLCFVIKTAFTYSGTPGEPSSYETKCFDLKRGEPCNALSFMLAELTHEEINSFLVDGMIKPKAKAELSAQHPYAFSEGMLDVIDELFTYENFYLTENGMAFYFEKNLINDSLSGVYSCELTWNELSAIFTPPADIQAIEYYE